MAGKIPAIGHKIGFLILINKSSFDFEINYVHSKKLIDYDTPPK